MSSALLFRQLYDQASGTWSYLLADAHSREAVLIDAVYEQYERDLAVGSWLEEFSISGRCADRELELRAGAGPKNTRPQSAVGEGRRLQSWTSWESQCDP